MKIYRFIPNGRDYAAICQGTFLQWWPDGIDLGALMRGLYPKPTSGPPWNHEGNRFVQHLPETPLSDFPAFALHLPVVSPRAAEVLVEAGLILPPVPMTASGKACFAVQPRMVLVEPDLSRAFVPERSRGPTLPNGEVLLYTVRVFEPDRIPGEFFTIPEFEPFSDLYVTERLVDVARSAGLVGLEYLELVFDEGPIEPVYPPPEKPDINLTLRAALERDLIEGRCDLLCYGQEKRDEAMLAALRAGQLSFDFVAPEYRRVDG